MANQSLQSTASLLHHQLRHQQKFPRWQTQLILKMRRQMKTKRSQKEACPKKEIVSFNCSESLSLYGETHDELIWDSFFNRLNFRVLSRRTFLKQMKFWNRPQYLPICWRRMNRHVKRLIISRKTMSALFMTKKSRIFYTVNWVS